MVLADKLPGCFEFYRCPELAIEQSAGSKKRGSQLLMASNNA